MGSKKKMEKIPQSIMQASFCNLIKHKAPETSQSATHITRSLTKLPIH